MNKTLIVLMTMVALAAPASAGAEIHAATTLPTGESHTVDVLVADDGSYTVLVDGEPVDPSALSIPVLPGVPALPGVPSLPALPTLP